MEVTAQAIAEQLGGEIVGDPQVKVSAPARIESGKSGNICFFANPKYEKYVYSSKASIILVNKSFEPTHNVTATLIKVDDAYQSIASVLEFFSTLKKGRKRGNSLFVCHPCSTKIGKGTHIEKHVTIGKHTQIGEDCYIFSQVYIGDNVKIGSDVIIYPGVRIMKDTQIGDRCILQPNCVIGMDGFGFAPREDGTYKKIPQTGNVVLEDDVEIGANTTVARSTMGSTIIHKGVKIDALCQIAHNVEIGDNTVMAAMCGIAGSSKIGKNCMFGGQCGVAGHLSVADHTTVAAQSGVFSDVKEGGKKLMGYMAFDFYDYLRAYSHFRAKGKKE